MAWGYLKMFQLTNAPAYRRKAEACLDWLDRHKSPRYENHSWANHFEFAGRGGSYDKNESIIVWTALIGQAYLDAYELLQEKRYLDIALSACRWILSLPREETSSGTCLSYLAAWHSSIHNSNMLGAALLARASRYSPDADDASRSGQIRHGIQLFTPALQRCLVLRRRPPISLVRQFPHRLQSRQPQALHPKHGGRAFLPHLRKGYTFYIQNFFEPDGRPKYYHNRLYPIDSQCAGQAIETLAFFSEDYPESLPLAYKVARWYIQNMQDEKGYFYYRMYPLASKLKRRCCIGPRRLCIRGFHF
jgi:hypothetical protein